MEIADPETIQCSADELPKVIAKCKRLGRSYDITELRPEPMAVELVNSSAGEFGIVRLQEKATPSPTYLLTLHEPGSFKLTRETIAEDESLFTFGRAVRH